LRRSERPGSKDCEGNDATEQGKPFNVLQHDLASNRCFILGNQISLNFVSTRQRWRNERHLWAKDTHHPEQEHGDAKAKHRTIPKRNSKAKRPDADEAWSDPKYDAPRPHDLKLGREHR
jgi:hypothetical protein